MTGAPAELSQDQAEAFDRAAELLAAAGIDLLEVRAQPARPGREQETLAILGRAGTGKTRLLVELFEAVRAAGARVVGGDWAGRASPDRRTVAVLAPTNKAASVLRQRGVPATTIHRILYTPVYHPEYERIAAWLAGEGPRPEVAGLGIAGLTEEALERAAAFHRAHNSIPGALLAAGLRGSDFIRGWARREDPLDIGFVDEASMLDARALADLQAIFPTLILFGDPAQLAPVGEARGMAFDKLPPARRVELSRIHRQSTDNPVLELAHALGERDLTFEDFERMVEALARRDPRIELRPRVDADLMARSPVLVWRNSTRVRLIHAFRMAHGAPEDGLLPGEPLVCDGIELPLRHRRRRVELEARGLVKGAQAVYLGPGRKPGFARLYLIGGEDPRLSVASIIRIERPDAEEPAIVTAATMGATFLHGAAITIHKAQGSQWPAVQLFAPDIRAAARAGRVEDGQALWKRLAYVAVTRAQERLIWVTRPLLARPSHPLRTDDLEVPATTLRLMADDAPE